MQVSDQLQKVRLTNPFGEAVFFDKNGDPPPSYDIINWQLREGQVDHVTVGHFGSTSDGGYKLSIQEEDIVWGTGHMVLCIYFRFCSFLYFCIHLATVFFQS